MNPTLTATPLTALVLLLAHAAAQDLTLENSERDPVLAELLDNPGDRQPPEAQATDEPEPSENSGPVLVEGLPPDGEIMLLEDAPEPLGQPTPDEPEAVGVEIEVEPGVGATGAGGGPIRIVAPFAAKRLAPPPPGWKIVHPDDTPARRETVTLADDRTVTLTIRPHVLIPDADGSGVFALSEPGFDPALGYDQKHTIGSVLADSIHQLDEQDARLSRAARRLSEMLDSLPPAEAADGPDDQPESTP